MSSIRLVGVAFAFSDAAPLFDDVHLHLESGWTGLVGPNGAGKTTLLRLLAGELTPSAGTVKFEPREPRVRSCPQEIEQLDEATRAFAASDDPDAFSLRGKLALEPARLADWSRLSPGERKRWQVGAALVEAPDVLLLDEPTNHLDAEARRLLIGALRRFHGVGLVVSHDRELLEALTAQTLRVADGEVRLWPGSYAAAQALWEAEARAAVDTWQQARSEQQRLRAHLDGLRRQEQGASRDRSAGRRMRDRNDSDARSLMADFRAEKAQKRLGKRVSAARQRVEQGDAELGSFPGEKDLGRSLFVSYVRPPQPVLLALDLPALCAGERRLLGPTRLQLGREDRVALVGPNGAGKTTLVSALLARPRIPRERILVLPQELTEAEALAALDAVRQLPPEARGRTLSLVAALGVDPARLLQTARPSPGEARKLLIAQGLGEHRWLLALDEPTNHLDLPAVERLETALVAYPGALLVVTHDPRFARAVARTTWRLAGGQVEVA